MFTDSPLYPICDVDACARAGWAPLDFARACFDGGARVVQLRAKRLGSGAFLALAEAVVRVSSAYSASIIVNDRVDLAGLSAAAGVHVGQDDLPVAAVRTQIGRAAIVGLSTHTLAQCEAASREAVSYVAIGPVFVTDTKQTGYAAVGLEQVEAARRLVPASVPIVAIGGITLECAAAVIGAGATAVAVIGDLLTADPAARVAQFLRALA